MQDKNCHPRPSEGNDKSMIVAALTGNPNSGKTTVFNNLTGARQHVGNWPGVTVEKKEGVSKYDSKEFTVVDLPGTYSVTAYSIEEMIVRNFISQERPDVVVDVVDASNLERNLYLFSQLIELGRPVILALNMMDEATKKGIAIDTQLLSTLLGSPVVPMVAVKNRGTEELKMAIIESVERGEQFREIKVNYGKEIEEEIEKIEEALKQNIEYSPILKQHNTRWLAIKALEGDEHVLRELRKHFGEESGILKKIESSVRHIESIYKQDIESVIVDYRYGFISGVVREAVKRERKEYESRSDKIDNILTNRILGLPFFALFMWLMFFSTFYLGKFPARWIEILIGYVADGISNLITSPHWIRSLLVDGIVGGVGSVIVFVPQIFIMFLFISIIEDSGYMARAAFIMDRLMHWLGLHGKSFIPMIMGFGCNVPAVMATRTLESERDRKLTILINPLVSCTARLPVYALFTAAFFAANQGTVTFSIYMLGIILAVLMAKLFRRFLFPGESEPFVMELPPYRFPTLKSTFIHMWERGSMFLRKAGTVILAGSMIMWILAYMPPGAGYGSSKSLAGRIGHFLQPVVKPLGFDWQAVVALIFGFVAKELVVSAYGTLFGVGEDKTAIIARIQGNFTPLSAYAFMAFTLLYTPCLATVAVIRKETGSWKWAVFAVVYQLILAWLVAFLIYQIGLLFTRGG